MRFSDLNLPCGETALGLGVEQCATKFCFLHYNEMCAVHHSKSVAAFKYFLKGENCVDVLPNLHISHDLTSYFSLHNSK